MAPVCVWHFICLIGLGSLVRVL
uniref:Uncharacterized protein n=1 Tax=Arundo donax TaxID=35708 RepID=A0A0A8YVG7_ARUDO